MLAAAEAVEMIGVELERRLLVRVERTLRRVTFRERYAHKLEQRRVGVVEVGEELGVVLLGASRQHCIVVIIAMGLDQPLELGLFALVNRRRGSLFWRFQIVRPAPNFTGEREPGSPFRRLEQNGEEFRFADRSGRNLGDDLVVYVQDNRNAAGLEPLDRRGQEIAGGALNDVLDEGAEPAPVVRPLAAGIVLEHHVGRCALELVASTSRACG